MTLLEISQAAREAGYPTATATIARWVRLGYLGEPVTAEDVIARQRALRAATDGAIARRREARTRRELARASRYAQTVTP